MSLTCTTNGPWAGFKGVPFFSKQEFQATFLLILCQAVNKATGQPVMSACATVAGAWNSIKNDGNGDYLSDQEFYANALSLLCTLGNNVGGGGGASTDYILEYANQAALPAQPADVNKVWMARFRDGSAGKTWSVVMQSWF